MVDVDWAVAATPSTHTTETGRPETKAAQASCPSGALAGSPTARG